MAATALVMVMTLMMATTSTLAQFDGIFFPDKPLMPTRAIRTQTAPECSPLARPDDPCVDDEEYDDNIKAFVSQLIRSNNNINTIVQDPLLKELLVDSSRVVPVKKPVSTRTQFSLEETPMCYSEEKIIFPKRGKTQNNDWVFVANQENIQQAVKVEQCISEGKPCNLGMSGSPIETVCRQKYVFKRLLAVDTNKLAPEEVLMPSCCVCYRVGDANFDIGVRVGNNSGTTSSVTTPTPPPPSTPPSPGVVVLTNNHRQPPPQSPPQSPFGIGTVTTRSNSGFTHNRGSSPQASRVYTTPTGERVYTTPTGETYVFRGYDNQRRQIWNRVI